MKRRRGILFLAVFLVLPLLPAVSGGWKAEAPAQSLAPWSGPVPKAVCGPRDRQESGLQGQTTPAERFGGAADKAFNCNLEPVGHFLGEGASWQMAWFDSCAYYGTANDPRQQHKGVVVIDASDPRHPRASAYLDSPTMLDPWESLKVNQKRKLLAAVQANGGNGKEPGFAVYDVSDCRHPVLKSSVNLSQQVKGHAGNFTPDGRTYYGTELLNGTYPIDVTDVSNPRLLTMWKPQDLTGLPHDLSMSEDGTRMYIAQPGLLRGVTANNGLVIADSTDVQKRRPEPQIKVIGTLFWKDGSTAQNAEPVKINGRPYVIFTDEIGSGGINGGQPGQPAACAQNLPPFAFARIIDISDEKNPQVVSKLMLEVHDPAHCSTLQNDPAFRDVFGYSSHYCDVDNPQNARLLACSYFQAGVRVFDIHDPYRPKEIAYYKPPAARTALRPGSQRGRGGADRTADWASSRVRFRKAGSDLQLWFTSNDNGFQIVKFTNDLASLGKNFTGQ